MTTVHVKDANGDEFLVAEWGGIHHPPFPGLGPRLDALDTLEFRPDDVLLCTYPKCGTQWIISIVRMLKNNSNELPIETPTYLEWVDQDALNAMSSPRVLATHLPKKFIPPDAWSKKIKVIIVNRNPKDVAVSFSTFKNACKMYEYNGTWNGFLPLFMQGKVAGGSWFDHSKEWFAAAHGNPNFLYLTYEEMKKDLLFEITKINEFLGYNRSEAFLKEVTQQCTFANMKRVRDGHHRELFKPGTTFFRKGEVADWKNWFTVAQNEDFDKLYKAEMADALPELKSRIDFG